MGYLKLSDLPHDVTVMDIENLFSKYGTIRHIDIESKCAFIYFFHQSAADEAIADSKKDLSYYGCTVQISESEYFEYNKTRVYVKHLPLDTNADNLKNFFSKYGTISNVSMTSQSAFIYFKDCRTTKKAFDSSHNGLECKGEIIKVEELGESKVYSIPADAQNMTQLQLDGLAEDVTVGDLEKLFGMYGVICSARFSTKSAKISFSDKRAVEKAFLDSQTGISYEGSEALRATKDTELYVLHIPHHISTKNLKQFFSRYGVISDAFVGCQDAFIDFEETSAAQEAFKNSQDGIICKGNKISVKLVETNQDAPKGVISVGDTKITALPVVPPTTTVCCSVM